MEKSLHIEIRTSDKEGSVLSTVCGMLGVTVSFLLTSNSTDTSYFTSSQEEPDHWRASLSNIETEDEFEIKTLINGKLIASKRIACQSVQEIKIV